MSSREIKKLRQRTRLWFRLDRDERTAIRGQQGAPESGASPSGLISDAWTRTDHAGEAMDAFDLFRKLGAGAKFDLKRFGKDAARFKVNVTYKADELPAETAFNNNNGSTTASWPTPICN